MKTKTELAADVRACLTQFNTCLDAARTAGLQVRLVFNNQQTIAIEKITETVTTEY